MMANAGAEFEGQFYDKVVQLLSKNSETCFLLKKKSLTHTHFDWRTKKPIIWRAVPQWFASSF